VPLQISIRESRDVAILDLRGRLTIDGGSELLSHRLKALVANGACKLLLNLACLSQVDSSGVSVIIDTVRSVDGQRENVKLLCPRGHVLQVLRVLHLTELISCFEDETQAIASFQPRGDYAATP
jgi:anti-anti-sigma factor